MIMVIKLQKVLKLLSQIQKGAQCAAVKVTFLGFNYSLEKTMPYAFMCLHSLVLYALLMIF